MMHVRLWTVQWELAIQQLNAQIKVEKSEEIVPLDSEFVVSVSMSSNILHSATASSVSLFKRVNTFSA